LTHQIRWVLPSVQLDLCKDGTGEINPALVGESHCIRHTVADLVAEGRTLLVGEPCPTVSRSNNDERNDPTKEATTCSCTLQTVCTLFVSAALQALAQLAQLSPINENAMTQIIGLQSNAQYTHLSDKHEREVPWGVIPRPIALLCERSERVSRFCEGGDDARGHLGCRCGNIITACAYLSPGAAVEWKTMHCSMDFTKIRSESTVVAAFILDFLTKPKFEMQDTMTSA
jgi:hypothetical protein